MSNLKERLQQIKDEVAKENGYEDWKSLSLDCSTYGYKTEYYMDLVCKRYTEEVINEVESELDRKIDWHHKQSLKARKSDKIKYEASTNCLVIFKMCIKEKFQSLT